MSDNIHIAVAGNIGAGKTTLTKKLSKHYGWQAELESVDNNPYLQDFYEDMEKWSFHLQVYFLNSRFEQLARLRSEGRSIIQDRTIYEDAHIFAKSLHQQGFFNDRDYLNYQSLYDSMIQFVQPPDLLIYLKSDISTLVKNIETRGREYENLIRIDYLKGLNTHYKDWIATYEGGKVLTLDVAQIDFLKNAEDFSDVVFKIDTELHGLFS